MLVTVVETPEFLRRARSIMSDAERSALVEFIAANPASGVSIGGGVRKLRFARQGKGKSGGYRVIYFHADESMPIFLITVFAKNEKANLSPQETEQVKQLGKLLAQTYRRQT